MLSVVLVNAGVEEWHLYTEGAIASLKEHAKDDFQLVIVDNGGKARGDINFENMLPYAEAVNKATECVDGDHILILNNDITARGDWQAHLFDYPYCGAKVLKVEGVTYVEGWCISIQRDVWHMVGGFNEVYKNSWEDVDLAWRLSRLGIYARHITMPMYHIWGATRHRYEWANQWDAKNRQYLIDRMDNGIMHKWRKL